MPKTYGNVKIDYFYYRADILTFASSTNLVRAVKIVLTNFKRIG